MEAVAVLMGFLILVAFGFALIGVPILWSRIKTLTQKVQRLESELKASELPAMPPQPEIAHRSENQSTPDALAEQSLLSEGPLDIEPTTIGQSAEVSPVTETKPKTEAKSKTQWSSIENVVLAATERQTPKTAMPSIGSKLFNRLLAMNITAQVGGIVLIFGAIFLGKYASDIGLLTLQAKLILMALVSVALVVAGSIFQKRLKVYADVLQGTGFAGWLVTLFVAHVLNHQMHWLITLIAGVSGVVFIGYRSLKQNSQPLAMVAFLGGFLTPFIASSEVSSLWRLFAYLTVLNVAVVGTAYYKPWRWLVREAYVASFGLLSLLMLAEYLQHDLQRLSTQLPMAMFIGLTLMAFSVLAWRWLATEKLVFIRHASGLLFGVPAAATIALQALFHHEAKYVSLSLVVAAIWYGVIFFVSRLKPILVIAIVMASAAVPYALSDSLTSLVYSIEGAAFAYWAIRFNRRMALIWGIGLQLLAAIFVVKLFQSAEVRETQLFVSWILNGAIIISALLCAWWFKKYQQPFVKYIVHLESGALTFGLLVWLLQWGFWLAETYSRQFTLWYITLVMAFSLVLVFVAAKQLRWALLAHGTEILAILFIATGLFFLVDYAQAATGSKLLSLSIVAIVIFAVRFYSALKNGPLADWDALATWFGLPLLASLALFFAPKLQTDWNFIWLTLLPLMQTLLLRRGLSVLFKPSLVRRFSRWFTLGVLFLLSLATLGRLGNYAPLPFWPLLHPLIIVCVIAAESLFRYVRRHRVLRLVWVIWLGAVITVELNRWLFHYSGVPFHVEAWLHSALTQTVWSIVWTLIGGLLMITAARVSHSRSRWMVGAVVLGLIVVKMFILDLAQVDTLYRILSFIGVGGLLLGIGYFAPMPSTETNKAMKAEPLENGTVEGN